MSQPTADDDHQQVNKGNDRYKWYSVYDCHARFMLIMMLLFVIMLYVTGTIRSPHVGRKNTSFALISVT